VSHERTYAAVSATEALLVPYPYIHVNDDGTVRELHATERRTLEAEFSPFDGARPYVKSAFDARDGWGNISGFCHRSKVPSNTSVAPAPAIDPSPPTGKAEQIRWLREKAVAFGFEVSEKPDGTLELKRGAPK
jgi:hypothetical protein